MDSQTAAAPRTTRAQAKSDSELIRAVEANRGLSHTTIPPRAHTWQADVETVHRIIEDEFYEVERFTSRSDFLRKAGSYNLWFNVARRNRGKEHKTPWELIHEREPRIDPAICALPPVYLDELFMKKLDSKLLWGTMLFRIPKSAVVLQVEANGEFKHQRRDCHALMWVNPAS